MITGVLNEDENSRTYAWNWFALHSGQRLQLVNFWLVSVAFLAAAFVQARSNHLVAVALGVSVTGVIASLAFMRLDRRTRQLVQVAEKALLAIEDKQATGGKDDVTALVKRAQQVRRSQFDSYRVVIEGLQLMVAMLFMLASIYCIITA